VRQALKGEGKGKNHLQVWSQEEGGGGASLLPLLLCTRVSHFTLMRGRKKGLLLLYSGIISPLSLPFHARNAGYK